MGFFKKDTKRYFFISFVATNVKDGARIFSNDVIEIHGYLNRKNIEDTLKYNSENPDEWDFTIISFIQMDKYDFENFDKLEVKDGK